MIDAALAYWRTGGPLMLALAAASFGIWFVFLRMRRRLLDLLAPADDFEEGLGDALRHRSLDETVTLLAGHPGSLPPLIANILQAVGRGSSLPDAFAEHRNAHLDRIERDTTLLTAFTAAAPLLGLLGTVIGMVVTFRALPGEFADTSRQVSAGISQALVTTQVGLAAAIPGLFGRARLQRLLDQARVRLASCKTIMVLALDPASPRP